MDSTFPLLPPEFEAAVAAQHGGPISVSSQQGEHVIMSMAIYRDMLGIASDDDFDRSVAELKISLAQAESGETLSLEEVRKRLVDKYGA